MRKHLSQLSCAVQLPRVFMLRRWSLMQRIIVRFRYTLMMFRLSRSTYTTYLINVTLISHPHMWSLNIYAMSIPPFTVAFKTIFRVANVTRTCRLICSTKLNWNACWLLSFQYCVESHEYKQPHQTENCKETLPRKHAEIKYEKNKLQKRTELKPTTSSRVINSNTKARRLPLLTAHLWGLPRTHHNRPRVHIWSLPLVTSTPRHKRNLKREDWDDNHRLIVFLAQYCLPKSAASKWKMTNLEYFFCAWVYVHIGPPSSSSKAQ